MKKALLIAMLFTLPFTLSACSSKPPTKVVFKDKSAHPHNGNFCPPGQAKKGNC